MCINNPEPLNDILVASLSDSIVRRKTEDSSLSHPAEEHCSPTPARTTPGAILQLSQSDSSREELNSEGEEEEAWDCVQQKCYLTHKLATRKGISCCRSLSDEAPLSHACFT